MARNLLRVSAVLRATLVLGLLAAAGAHGEPGVECMARTEAGWSALSFRPEMTARYCAPAFELPLAFPPQAYQLTDGPMQANGKVTCRWRWVPNGFHPVIPGREVPEAVVCTLPL